LRPDVDKIIAAIGFLIEEAERRRSPLTQYDIVKSLFFADRAHLNNFGRPITFDNYVAMKHGPVPSLAYDLLKGNEFALTNYGVGPLPWVRRAADHLGLGCFTFTNSTNGDLEQVLSPSDMESLSEALTIISGLTFGQVRELTHNDPAYKEAWNSVGEALSNKMSLGLLFDTPNFAMAEEIEFISKHAAPSTSLDDEFDLSDFDQGSALPDR
jgi:hypothetical protein